MDLFLRPESPLLYHKDDSGHTSALRACREFQKGVFMNRLEALQELLKKEPNDPLLHYMLANEYLNAGQYPECVASLERYLALAEDEGAAYRTLAQALIKVGRVPEARQAYEAGIRAAQKFDHPSMVLEYQEALQDLA